MFLTRNRPQKGRFGAFGYGTAGTTTTTTLASTGGLLVNIDSATGDTPRTTAGWIEDQMYGFYARIIAGTGSFEFDTAVTRTGSKTLKVSCTNVTGVVGTRTIIPSPTIPQLYTGTPVKASTKYKVSCWVKTTSVAALAVYLEINEYNSSATLGTSTSSNKLSGTNDWTLCTATFTTAATATFVSINCNNAVAGNVSDAWFDINSMTFEEVVEPVANSLITPSPSLVSFTAVGSTDNIDTSLDPTFVAANTYTPPVAISETATNKQTFTPTKSKLTRIGVYPVAKGTGNWTVTVHDASNVVQAVITIANASLTNGTVNYFNVPCNLTALGTYHFHVTSTVADGTVRVATASDLETVSYIQNYYEPTTNFKASQNNSTVSISSDADGFMEGAVTNITTGAYTWGLGVSATDLLTASSVYSATAGAGAIVTTQTLINNYGFYNYAGYNWIGTPATTNTQDLIWKFTTTQPITGDVTVTFRTIERTGGTTTMAYSTDNSSYTTMGTIANSANTEIDYAYTITGLVGETDFFLRFRRAGTSSKQDIANLAVSTTVNTTSLNSLLKNYPTNKDVVKAYTKTLGSPTTTATYRATKWGFPAIEFSSTEYQYLDIDTTATGSTVAFSELGSSYTTVADGASIAITSTSTPTIWVKHNITANRIFLSSNDYTASSDKDGSMKQSVVYSVIQ